jgi:hypothetical protein
MAGVLGALGEVMSHVYAREAVNVLAPRLGAGSGFLVITATAVSQSCAFKASRYVVTTCSGVASGAGTETLLVCRGGSSR